MIASINTVAFQGIDVLPIDVQAQVALIIHFNGSQSLSRPTPEISEEEGQFLDLRDIKNQESAKRALEVTAAGGHNLLMMCPITSINTRKTEC